MIRHFDILTSPCFRHCVAVGAQSTTTASLFEAIFDSVDLAGSVAGVGADGTTYVLSAAYTVEADDDTTIAFPITSEFSIPPFYSLNFISQ